MTIREAMRKYLTDNGLWPDEADAVLASAEKSLVRAFAGRGGVQSPMTWYWDDDSVGSPKLLAAVELQVKSCALEWIDENQPAHFARPAFRERDVAVMPCSVSRPAPRSVRTRPGAGRS